MANRYALRMDRPNSWTVFDIFTGQPAEVERKVMVGIKTRRAEKLVVQIVAVGYDHYRRVLELRTSHKLASIECHQKALARTLRVPDNAAAF